MIARVWVDPSGATRETWTTLNRGVCNRICVFAAGEFMGGPTLTAY